MTDPLLTFKPALPFFLVTVIIVITAIILFVIEIRKRQRHSVLRFCCAAAIVISVAGILLRPQKKTSISDFTILVTENTEGNIIDSLEKEFETADFVYLAENTTKQKPLLDHSLNEASVKIITGDGLTASMLDQFQNFSFNYIASDFPKGVIRLNIPREISEQVPSTISGVHNSPDSAKIILYGPGGKEDSVILSNGMKAFSLNFLPKQAGRFVYRISVDGTAHELPLIIKPRERFKVLVVQMFPTFETGYLKKLLAHDHQAVFRYQLSKNNFRYEFINHPNVRLDRLTSDLLHEFDLVLMDAEALISLTPGEKKSVESGVSAGLGLLVLFNEIPKTDRTLDNFLRVTFRRIQKDTAQFELGKKISLPAWPVVPASDHKIIPVIQNKTRTLAGYVYQGFGKTGFQLLQETYALMLKGDSSSYKNLWTSVIEKTARTKNEKFRISITSDFPVFKNEPIGIEVIGRSATAPTLLHDSIEITMSEDLLIDDLWKTTVWPRSQGWHQLQIKGDTVKRNYFVSKDSEWKTLATANSIRNTKAQASSSAMIAEPSIEYQPFAPWLFYLFFLIGASVLWLIPKL